MMNAKLLVSALALVAVGGGISACTPGAAAAGHTPADARTTAPTVTGAGSGMGSGSPMTSGVSTGPGHYVLRAMPAGTVSVERGAHGRLRARVTVSGLTPGSSHAVSIDGPLGRPVRFPALTANSAGQADTTLTSVDRAASARPLSRFVIRLGDAAGDPLAREPIAESSLLPVRYQPGSVFALHAVTVDVNGVSLGQPAGRAILGYNATARTLTVTVTASGLNPGPHAAHIHLGSCQHQDGVKYMMADFVADARGEIINQTRVVTGVASVPGPGNWYLNLHQGGMNQILADGVPTLVFRPMLCTDITGFAVADGAAVSPAASPSSASPSVPAASSTPTGTPTMTMPTGTPTTTPAGTPTVPVPADTPTGIPTNQPTHY